jgi:hypothetical protein
MTSPAVQALLTHLADRGFDGLPEAAGSAATTPYPYALSDEGVSRVGAMLRRLHEASSDFRLPPGTAWAPWWMHDEGPGSVIGHCDAGPWHVLARDGRPVAFTGWDLAGPVNRLDEVAAAALWNASLRDDDIAERYGFPDVEARARQAALFLEGYALPRRQRHGMVDAMIEFCIRDCAAEAVAAGITPESGDPASLWALAWRARAAAWLIRHRTTLERAVRR